ncbi:MAG: hemerythrin domain-containing protein [Actinomycetota bacterium]|nr:hemerythrin domain-containing protein [Actinomycetota bacterium]
MTDDSIDVREMLGIHDALRKEFASLPLMEKGVADGDAERAGIVGDHILFMCDLLQSHHEGEDATVWPILQERAPEHAALIESMVAQHHALEAMLLTVREQVAVWQADPHVNNRAALHTSLIRLERLLLDHLSHEETDTLPVIAATFSPAEFAAVGEHARGSLPPDKLMIAMGMILDDTTSDIAELMLSGMPPEARAGFDQFGRPAYAAYRERLLG